MYRALYILNIHTIKNIREINNQKTYTRKWSSRMLKNSCDLHEKTVTFLGVNGMQSCDREEIIFKLFKM